MEEERAPTTDVTKEQNSEKELNTRDENENGEAYPEVHASLTLKEEDFDMDVVDEIPS